MTLKKNILKNGFASLMQKGLRVGEQLLLVPFFLSAWGAAYYGEWLTLSAFPMILSLSDVGIGSSAANTFVLTYLNKDYQKAKRIYRAGVYLISSVILIGVFLGAIIIFILDYTNTFNALEIPKIYSIKVLCVLMVTQLVRFYDPLLGARFLAIRKAAQSINIQSVRMGLQLVISIMILLLGGEMLAISIGILVITILSLITNYLITLNKLAELTNIKVNNVKQEFKDILMKGLSYLLNPLWQSLFFQGSTIIVRTLLGPQSVAVFNTVRTLTRSVNQLFIVVNVSIFPEMQYEYGRGNLDIVRKLFRGAFVLVSLIATTSIFALGLFGPYFYGIWTQGKLEVPLDVWWLMIIAILFNAQWWTSVVIFRATNEPRAMAVSGVISASLTLLCSWFLTKEYGLIGTAISMFVMEIMMLLLLLPRGLKLIEQPLKGLYSQGFNEMISLVRKILNKNSK